MNQDEHQRERMRHWSAVQVKVIDTPAPNLIADHSLAEWDKRFPAPAAVEVAKAPALTTMSLDVAETILAQEAELASLRTKARYWDAVASGKFSLNVMCDESWTWDTNLGPCSRSRNFHTAEEAVQSAIDAGALK